MLKSVASFTEAWIEITKYFLQCHWQSGRLLHGGVDWNALVAIYLFLSKSPPSRRRGLKLIQIRAKVLTGMSPPSRRRGLKYRINCKSAHHSQCRLLHGGVDWNNSNKAGRCRIVCRLLHGGVDWNRTHWDINVISCGRLLHGGVDWNGDDNE